MMRIILPTLSLWLAAVSVHGQEIIPVTQTVQYPSAAIATGTGSATLVPFNVDLTAQPNYTDYNVFQRYSTSVWESKVAVIDDSSSFNSFVSLRWPRGEGPGARPVAPGKEWNGCVIALPQLFELAQPTSSGNGSCIDVLNGDCVATLTSNAMSMWEVSIRQESSLTPAAYARACQSIDNLLLVPTCLRTPSAGKAAQFIRAYPNDNPTNGQAFMLGIDDYKGSPEKKRDLQQTAISRVWPLIILETENAVPVNAVMTCPSAGFGYFQDSFGSGNLSGWTQYDGSFDALSKALLAKSSSGGKALIDGHTFGDFTFDADITPAAGTTSGDGGLVFRVSKPSNGTDTYRGYYTGFDASTGNVVLGRANNDWHVLAQTPISIQPKKTMHFRVQAAGETISIFVDDLQTPKISIKDKTYSSGQAGVRVFYADVIYENLSIKPLAPKDSVPSPDGTCGGAGRYSCTNTTLFYGKCCGGDGFCGYSDDSCAIGCQSQFGLCDTVVTVTTTGQPTLPTSTSTPSAMPTLSDGWNSIGCYRDLYPATKRILRDYKGLSDPLSVDTCRTQCFSMQYKYSGVENGNECWCGNELQDANLNVIAWPSDCAKYTCPGNATQSCGAGARINLSQYVAPAKPSWATLGCYRDVFPQGDRALQETQVTIQNLTAERCRDVCATKQYKYSGVENGGLCFCGNSIQSPSDNSQAALSDCSVACPGDTTTKCGGRNRILLSQLTLGTGSSWQPIGCYKDTAPSHARTLSERVDQGGDLTIEKCQASCLARNYIYSGMEDGRECWCGNDVQSASSNTATSLSECGKGCPGNSKQSCGGSNRINLSKYFNPARKSWVSIGCYKDTADPRTLQERIAVGTATTLENCRAVCLSRGFQYTGVEDGWECWCGNEIRKPLSNAPTDMSNCNKRCSGNYDQDCGGSGFVHIFKLQTTQ